ncbi:MAG: hypothetical protein WDN06_00745 [Asticcacaulis sp.]
MNAITPTIPQNANPANSVQSVESVVLDLGLKAQSRLLPYALGFFGIGLPLFLWTARLSLSPWLMAFYMLLFIVDWTVFMVLRAQAEKRAAAPSSERNLQSRLWRQSVGGGLWAFTLFVICLTRVGFGKPRRNLPDDLRRRRRRRHPVLDAGPAQSAGAGAYRHGRAGHRLP